MPEPLNLFIISGPSGVGEDSIIEGLHEHLPIERVITTTSRQMRPGDKQGSPYYFISKEEFERKIEEGSFIEYAKEYNDNYYGVTKEELDRVLNSDRVGIWKIEWQGVISAKKLFPQIKAIFITVSDLQILEERIKRRHPNVTQEYLDQRRVFTKEWMKHTNIYDYVVYNEEGKLNEAIEEVRDIIQDNLPKDFLKR